MYRVSSLSLNLVYKKWGELQLSQIALRFQCKFVYNEQIMCLDFNFEMKLECTKQIACFSPKSIVGLCLKRLNMRKNYVYNIHWLAFEL